MENFAYLNNEKDEILIERIKRGDNDIFAVIVERYKMKVYNLVYRMVQNRDDTEDLVQEIFIKVYRSLNKYKSDFPFYPWIMKIAYNHTISFIRKEKREKEMMSKIAMVEAEDPVKEFSKKEFKKKISLIFSSLEEEYRAVLSLRMEGLSYKEIGKILNIPIGTVMSRISRGREIIQKNLKEAGYEL